MLKQFSGLQEVNNEYIIIIAINSLTVASIFVILKHIYFIFQECITFSIYFTNVTIQIFF